MLVLIGAPKGVILITGCCQKLVSVVFVVPRKLEFVRLKGGCFQHFIRFRGFRGFECETRRTPFQHSDSKVFSWILEAIRSWRGRNVHEKATKTPE